MSEYQYYEFQAIDRRLTQPEVRDLRALSTRAQITSTRFVNFYNYGDFRGSPERLMEQYFDAFLYYANWGTRRLMFRLPRRLVDAETVSQYCSSDHASHRIIEDAVILEFLCDDESGDYFEEEDDDETLGSLIPVRAELLAGDLRALYLGWLLSVRMGDFEDEEEEVEEPPVPPGLGDLSGSLAAFAEFLRIDADLIAAAAERSPGSREIEPSRDEWIAWIRRLPDGEKEELLLRALEDQDPHLRGELLKRFQQEAMAASGAGTPAAAIQPRTVGELVATAERRAEERRRQEAERRAAEAARRQRGAAAARARYLEGLRGREPQLWPRIEALIATKRPNDYDQAVTLLVDLRDLAAASGQQQEFETRVRQLRERHAAKPSLMARLNKAGMGAGTASS